MFDDVLAWVNDIRALNGREPRLDRLPKGIRGDVECCVIARAIELPAGGTFYEAPDGQLNMYPEEIKEFVRNFDDGKYPELEEE